MVEVRACVSQVAIALAYKSLALGCIALGVFTQVVSLGGGHGIATPFTELQKLNQAAEDYEFIKSAGYSSMFWDAYGYPIALAFLLGAAVVVLLLDCFAGNLRLVTRCLFGLFILLAYLIGSLGFEFFVAVPTGVPFLLGAGLGFFLPYDGGRWLGRVWRGAPNCAKCGQTLLRSQRKCPECGLDRAAGVAPSARVQFFDVPKEPRL